MRSTAELAFRARQELANLYLLAAKPSFIGSAPAKLNLPDPNRIADRLRDSEFASRVQAIARQIVEHRFPLLGTTVDTGLDIRWRRDYAHSRESGSAYFRRIPYLTFEAVGDHKIVWELNRHPHLVLLAQAFLFSRNPEFLNEIVAQLESWFEQNPFQRGINWASALEVGFRALSWIWVYHLAGPEVPEGVRRRLLTGLYRHGLHLAHNLSVYFSPNTHLLGEAVALYALGTLFPNFSESAQWRARGADVVRAQLDFQVRADGSHFEQSTYYHIYALDLFLFFYVLAGRPPEMRTRLEAMADYLFWLLGPARRITFFGDDDGGRLFHPYGERDTFGRATLATAGALFGCKLWAGNARDLEQQAVWWEGAEALDSASSSPQIATGSRLFPDAGMAFLSAGDLFVQIDAGPFGYGGAGHSHSDTLSLVVWLAGERVLVDPGTYNYIADARERDWFRGSGAHNTIRIDGLNQARAAGPFRWEAKPEVFRNAWRTDAEGGFLDATCRYRGFEHRRRVLLRPGSLLVLDEIAGSGDHVCEQIWQLGPAADKVSLSCSAPAAMIESEYSPAYGAKQPGRALVATWRGELPTPIAMLLETGGQHGITVDQARRMLGE